MNVKYGQVSEPLLLQCGTEQVFNLRGGGNDSSCRIYQKKLADRNVCLV